MSSEDKDSNEIDHATDRLLIGDLADCLVEFQEENHQEVEPFEIYAQRLRMHFQLNTHRFHHRFVKGYESLMDYLRSHLND